MGLVTGKNFPENLGELNGSCPFRHCLMFLFLLLSHLIFFKPSDGILRVVDNTTTCPELFRTKIYFPIFWECTWTMTRAVPRFGSPELEKTASASLGSRLLPGEPSCCNRSPQLDEGQTPSTLLGAASLRAVQLQNPKMSSCVPQWINPPLSTMHPAPILPLTHDGTDSKSPPA